MTWNHDISTAPQGGAVWLATKCGKVFRSYRILEPRRDPRWAGHATGEEIIAWHPFGTPAHPDTAAVEKVSLTVRQAQLLGFIRSYCDEHDGVSPSYDEMKDFLGLASKGRIHELVQALGERGCIRRLANRPRSIAVVEVAA